MLTDDEAPLGYTTVTLHHDVTHREDLSGLIEARRVASYRLSGIVAVRTVPDPRQIIPDALPSVTSY